MGLKEAVMEQFNPEIGLALVEFGKSLSAIDADVLVFMARKSLCLYDVLLKLGVEPSGKCVVSDRILEMSMTPWRGKRMALVDDTLILGTSLAEARARLEGYLGQKVPVHVFCVDTDYWCQELVQPDSLAMKLTNVEVMTFTMGAIRALSVVPRPYLVDFPLTTPLRLSRRAFRLMLSPFDWTAYTTSSRLQERNGVHVFTFLPESEVMAELQAGLGERVASCLDIVKVRAFTREYGDEVSVQFMPIVTLKALREPDVAALVDALLDRVSRQCGRDLCLNVLSYLETSLARQRLAQYCLSSALGGRFARSVGDSFGSAGEWSYLGEETDRHYGPHLHDDMQALGRSAYEALWTPDAAAGERRGFDATPAPLPADLVEWASKSLPSALDVSTGPRSEGNGELPLDLFGEVTKVFLRHHDLHELPARYEVRDKVKELGREGFLRAGPDVTPEKDRLKKGIPWALLTEHVCRKYGDALEFASQQMLTNMLSLVLDQCNDLGILVPVTCMDQGVVFRAYRHGEPVEWSQQEAAYVHDVVGGLLAVAGRSTVPRLVMEKLLVLFIMIGASEGWLRFCRDPRGDEETVRIRFSLKGAVAKLNREPTNPQAQEEWLTEDLVERGVLREGEARTPDGPARAGLYTLGVRPAVRFPSGVDSKARRFGRLIGKLLLAPAGAGRPSPLNDQALILLSSCTFPRYVAEALKEELRILRKWFDAAERQGGWSVDWTETSSIKRCLDALREDRGGYGAVHSARFKLIGYLTDRPDAIVQDCQAYLARTLQDEDSALDWKSYWDKLRPTDPEAEKTAFGDLILEAASLLWELAAFIFQAEVALRVARHRHVGHTEASIRGAVENAREFGAGLLAVGLREPKSAGAVMEALSRLESASLRTFDAQGSYAEALVRIAERLPSVTRLVERIQTAVDLYGVASDHYTYDYVLWYDIIDSRGNEAKLRGEDLEQYKRRVLSFKREVNGELRRLAHLAERGGGEVYSWKGDMNSLDDEKHVFIRGCFARSYLDQVLHALFDWCLTLEVRVRVCIAPCGFAGTAARRWERAAEVVGDAFWHHFSGLQKHCRTLQKRAAALNSFLLIATKPLYKEFAIPPGTAWVGRGDRKLLTEVGAETVETDARVGGIAHPPKTSAPAQRELATSIERPRKPA